jgi:cyclase
MDRVTRREVLIGGAAVLGVSALELEGIARPRRHSAEVGKADAIGSDIYFHEGDIKRGHCNSGWVVFEDYVLVIDASFPSSAKEILPKIRAITDKPIRFAFDTHHHGDHAYGNRIMLESGATPLAHTGVIEEMKRFETGYYGGAPGRWEDTAKTREDVKASKLKPPSLLFPHELIFDDGKHRVELMYLGVAHTHGDAFAWLPKERILFTGDACVNGPFNFVGDGDIEKWVGTLDAARKLGAGLICPGHGPREADSLLSDQQAFFKTLREQVGALVQAKKSAQEVQEAVKSIEAAIVANERIKRYSGGGLATQVEKVYFEMTGEKFPAAQKTAQAARRLHAVAHGLQLG